MVQVSLAVWGLIVSPQLTEDSIRLIIQAVFILIMVLYDFSS